MRDPRPFLRTSTRRKAVTWYDTDIGPVPDCTECVGRYLDPTFIQAVHSVAIEHPDDPADLARTTIDRYHQGGHIG